MCKFCDMIKSGEGCVKIMGRSSYSKDNAECMLDEISHYEQNWYNTDSSFGIVGYKYNENTYIQLDYWAKFSGDRNSIGEDDFIVAPYSESLQINFCPMCGTQISRNLDVSNENEQYMKYIKRK